MAFSFLEKVVGWMLSESSVEPDTLSTMAAVALFSAPVVGYIVYGLLDGLYRKLKKYPPGVFGIPYFGSTFSIFYYSEDYFFTKTLPEYGPISMYYIGNTSWMAINDIKVVKAILNHKSCLMRPKGFSEAFEFSHDKRIIADVVFSNPAWSQRRKSMFTAIRSIGASGYIEPRLNELVTRLIYPSIEENMTEWYPREDMRYVALNTVVGALFGFDKCWAKSSENFITFSNNLKIITKMLPMVVLGTMFYIPSIFGLRESLLGSINKVFLKKYTKAWGLIADNLTYPAMKEYKEKIEKNGFELENKTLFEEMYSNILSGSKDYDEITEEMLVTDSYVLFAAAIDTTTSTLEYAIYVIGQQLGLQEELYKELIKFSETNPDAKGKRVFNHDQFNKCVKFRAFIHEAVRLSVAVPRGGARHVSEKCVLKYDMNKKSGECENIVFGTVNEVKGSKREYEYIIDKCSILEPNFLYLMRDGKQYWGENSSSFDISKWIKIDANGKETFKNNGNLLTFSFGKRNCVGQLIAQKELRIILANLILNYEMKFQKGFKGDIEWENGLTRSPKPMPLVVTKRIHQ